MRMTRISVVMLLVMPLATTAWAQNPIPQLAQRAEAPAGIPLLERPALLTIRDVPLEAALLELTRTSGAPLAFSPARIPAGVRASCACEGSTVGEALDRLLKDTPLEYSELAGQVVLYPARGEDPRSGVRRPSFGGLAAFVSTMTDGIRELMPVRRVDFVAGIVVDAQTGEPVQGAQVAVEGAGSGVTTDAGGRFRIDGLSGDVVTLRVHRLGYRPMIRSVPVGATDVRIALEQTAIRLDEVVVTGTAFPTRMRTLSNPINVIGAEAIEAKGAASVTDLLRGEVPGLMPLSFGSQDYQTHIYVRGNATWNAASGGDYIKVYIDGVEVANPWALSTIDPRSIERIEVVRGPQASSIYGSEAASGVLQIFTKKGRAGLDRPEINARVSVAYMEGEYTPDGVTPLAQDHGVEVVGGSDAFSYRIGGTYQRRGEWVPGYAAEGLNVSGGLRAVQGPLTVELSALWSDREQSPGGTPMYWRYPADACPPTIPCGRPDYSTRTIYTLGQSTMGVNLSYQATPRWHHSLTLGDDQNQYGYYKSEPAFLTPADTFVNFGMTERRRRSIRYNTAYDAELAPGVTGRFTAGVDHWTFEVQGGGASNLASARPLRTTSSTVSFAQNDRWWNTGYFGMAEVGLADRFFVTLATRLEDNPRLGEDYGRAVSPRIGMSHVRPVGPAEVKLRAQYGKGIRPPAEVARVGGSNPLAETLPNPEIGPEEKVGWDAGIEVYLGERGSFAVTRFDEEGRNLIQPVTLDAAAQPPVQQYQNVGRAGSKGWELEGTLNAGAFTLRASYAYSDNTILELSNQFPEGPNQVYQVGDRMLYSPKHSGGATVSGRFWRGGASLSMSVLRGRRALDYDAYYGYLFAGEEYRGSTRDYYVEYADPPKWNFAADQALTDRITAFLQVENLTKNHAADIANLYVAPGRTTMFGLRLRH